jgi:hypothetical protein
VFGVWGYEFGVWGYEFGVRGYEFGVWGIFDLKEYLNLFLVYKTSLTIIFIGFRF